jgi:hypothetical protein
MIANLIETLPELRHPVLRGERGVLNRAFEKLNEFPEDLALAQQPDVQGLG